MTHQEKNEILEILNTIPTELRVFEGQVNLEKIEEYENLSKQNSLKEVDINNSEKIKLVKLSKKGDVKSYREIERIISSSKNKEIIDFANVALKFARLNLEDLLMDEPATFISAALGGKENKLRYFFAVKSTENISKEKEQIIQDELKLICLNSDSEFESIENFGSYVLIKILVSVDFAIGDVIEQLIDRCNFLDQEYFCTNVERPSNELLEEWLNNQLQ